MTDIATHIAIGFAALAVAAAAGFLLLVMLDKLIPPRWMPWRGFTPLCWLFGHDDEDMDEDEPEFGVCFRCGSVFWDAGDRR